MAAEDSAPVEQKESTALYEHQEASPTGLRPAPTPEDVARAYYRAHGDFFVPKDPKSAWRRAMLAGLVALVIVVVVVAGVLLVRTSPTSSATTGSNPTIPAHTTSRTP